MPLGLAAMSAGQYRTGIEPRRFIAAACSVGFPIARPTLAGPSKRSKMAETVLMGLDATKRIAGSQDETYREMCFSGEMTEPNERLQLARSRAGYPDPTSAAKAFSWNDVTYRAHEAGGRGIRRDVAEKYAKAFRVSAAWLMHGEGAGPSSDVAPQSEVRPSTMKAVAIRVAGTTEAGAFREVDQYEDDGDGEFVFDEHDAEFPRARMMAFDVAGDSMNQADPPILPGARVVCVDFGDTGLPYVDGMLVVVERTQDGGRTREWSIKEVEALEDRTVFHPRSSNKKHQPIVMWDDPDKDPGQSAEVIGLVRSVIYGVASGRRRNPRKR